MKTLISALGIALLSGILCPAALGSPRFNKIYIFGDSLSDTGNVFSALAEVTQTEFPPPPYFKGRFSNGPIWIDYLAQDLNLLPIPAAEVVKGNPPATGINFATGGATTGLDNALSPLLGGLEVQIGLIATLPPDPTALYILWAGANDYLPVNRSLVKPYLTPDIPVNHLAWAVRELYLSGARQVLVVNLPMLGKTPLALSLGTQAADNLDTLSQAHDALLATRLNSLNQTLPGIHLRLLDINPLFEQALAGELEFTHKTTPCYDQATGRVCDHPDAYLFWDEIHPTTAAHRYIADWVMQALTSDAKQLHKM
jgi:phospholipase/lecithinase/hemolysin